MTTFFLRKKFMGCSSAEETTAPCGPGISLQKSRIPGQCNRCMHTLQDRGLPVTEMAPCDPAEIMGHGEVRGYARERQRTLPGPKEGIA
jgi:hypothetical protein